MSVKTDISNRADIEIIITAFYEAVTKDAAIGFFFTDIAKLNLEQHLPKIINFWERILFGTHAYSGDLYQTHKQLHLKVPLNQDHFDWWLYLFHKAIDNNASGEIANKMKQKSTQIGQHMAAALIRDEPYTGLTGLAEYTPE